VVAVLAVALCVYLMLNLTGATWTRFLVWMALGIVVYFGYSRRHSRLGQRTAAAATSSRGV
jgi:APA family basic amino acid/polyamine antiporter